MSHGVMDFDIVAFFGNRRESARLLRAGEVIPSELEAGFDILGQLDPDWVWVLDMGGIIKGVLVASPCHGAAMIWRISIAKDASNLALARLLRGFLKDMRKRKMVGYITFLSMERENEARLADIIRHSGGLQIGTEKVVALTSKIPREGI